MQPDHSAHELPAVFARVHGMLLSEESATGAVHRLAQAVHQAVASSTGAGVSLLDEQGRRISTGATDPAVEAADALQYELGEGPCLTAWATATPQYIADTAHETRWPRWSAAAATTGIRSVLNTPLMHEGRCLGAMKVYATTPAAFGDGEEQLLGLLAAAAATLLGAAQTREAPQRISDGLKAALHDRQTVAVATGVLMERHDLDQDSAQQRLLHDARTQGRPLVQTAGQVLDRRADDRR